MRPSSWPTALQRRPPAILHRSTPLAPLDVNVGADRRSHSNAERSTAPSAQQTLRRWGGGASRAASDTSVTEDSATDFWGPYQPAETKPHAAFRNVLALSLHVRTCARARVLQCYGAFPMLARTPILGTRVLRAAQVVLQMHATKPPRSSPTAGRSRSCFLALQCVASCSATYYSSTTIFITFASLSY